VATISGNTVTIVGAGTTTITAIQGTTTTYNSSQTTTTFQVNKGTPTFDSFLISTKTYGDASFNITDPSSNSDGSFNYTSSDINVATISGKTITIVGAGTTTITATQAASANYNSSQTTTSFTVNKGIPTFGSFLIAAKIYGAVPFNITNPSSNSDGSFNYTSSDTSVATISGNTVTIVGVGTTTITATQAETANFNSSQTTTSFTVNKSTPIIGTFSLTAKTYLDPSFNITNPSSVSDGTFTYTSSNTGVATISGNTVTIVGAGTSTITATQAATANFNSATKTTTLTVNKANPTYGTFSLPTKTYGDSPFNVPFPTSNSNGLFTGFTQNPLFLGFFSGNTYYITNAGTTTITVNQASTANFNSSSTSASFTVNKANPTLGEFSIAAKTFGNSPFTVTDPTSNSDGTFNYISSNTGVATISGKTVTIVGAGTTTIIATQASTSNYNSAQTTPTFQVNKATPIFGRFFIEDKFFNDGNFTITPPTSTSDGPFVYTSSNTQIVDISGDIAVLTGLGSCTITATQQETSNYLSNQTSSTFNLFPTNNPVFDSFIIPNKNYGNSPFVIPPPNADYVGTYTYTSSNTNIATISGNTITIVGAGKCTITASKPGIFPINGIFTVNKINPTISNLNNITKNSNQTTFQINDPSSNSNGTFEYTSLNPSVATISGNTVTIIKDGLTVIKITQLESNNYFSDTIFTNLYVSKPSPNINNLSLPSQVQYGDIFYVTDLSSNSDGLFNLNSSNNNVAITYNNVIVFVGVGTTTITATQIETSNYTQGQTTKQIECLKATPIYDQYLIPSKTYGDVPFYIKEPSSSSNAPFTYTSSNTSVIDICGNYVTILGIGSSTITVTQPETNLFLSGTITATITVQKQMPTFGPFTIPQKTASDPSFIIVPPTSNSTGNFTFQSNDTVVASISGNVMTINSGNKIVKITATQLETSLYQSKSVDLYMFISG